MATPLQPDLSTRPFHLTAVRTMATKPDLLFRAWTEQFDRWFAAPGSVFMKGEINSPFSSKRILKESAIRTTGDFLGSNATDWLN